MEWIPIFVPILLSILALYIYRHKLIWWEVALPTLVSLVIIGVMKVSMTAYSAQDVEYFSEYITEARYYEEWDEWIEQTCSEPCNCTTDDDGYTSCDTCYYDCSYRDYNPEFWQIRTNMGNAYRCTQGYYKYLVKLFNNETFVDMRRDYYTIDGDMYRTQFDGIFEHVIPMSYEHTYVNKPQAAHTIFQFDDLLPEDTEGLYQYPQVVDRKQDACLGCTDKENERLRIYNGLNGRKHEIKMFVLVFEGKDISIAEKQRHFWKGGNKNELVVCTDSEGSWTKTFSWCDDKSIEVESNYIFNDTIPMKHKIDKLVKLVDTNWKRKHFEDFSYIKVPLTNSQIMWIYIIVSIFSIGLLAFGIFNDIDQDGRRNNYYRY